MKKIIICLMGILMLSSLVSAITLEDLDIPDKMTLEEYLIENFESITQMNVEDLDGEGYEIMSVGDKYIIVVIDGEIIVVFI